MIPILLGAGAAFAALFLSGCSDNKKSTQTQAPSASASGSAPPPPPPPDAGAPADPGSFPVYYNAFGNDLRAAQAYQKLVEMKVTDETLDRGCHYPVSLQARFFERAKDRRIDACEVYDYALENHVKYPEAAWAVTGDPIPWTLDYQTLVRVQEVVTKLQESPGLKKFAKDSDDYKRRLGTALALFVDFPKDPTSLQAAREALSKKTAFLAAWELQDFQKELLEKGGLGGSKIAETMGPEWVENAQQALALGQGGPGARAKILYAALEKAELRPVFVLATDKSTSDLFEEGTKGMPFLLNYGGSRLQFIQVAVPLNEMDPASKRPSLWRLKGLGEDAGAAGGVQELGLTTFLAMDFQEQGDFALIRSKGNPSSVYKNAVHLYPTDTVAFNSIGVLLEKGENLELAEVAYKEALRFDATNAVASYNLGRIYERLEKHQAATDAFLNVAVFSTDILESRAGVIEPVVKKVLAKDAQNPNAMAIVSKLKELRSDKAAEKADAGQ
ncbi:MAG TPA: hypothetical protein VJR29_03305 [bacterium]|nr:hypothetical protein [bacterium]